MSQTLKTKLIHAAQVAVASLFTLISAQLLTGSPISWSLNFWVPIFIGAVAAGVKTISDPAIPTTLGGTKQVI